MINNDVKSGVSLPVNFQYAVISSKAIATEIARFGLAGHVVHTGNAGDFTICKYGLAKYCQNFAELQAFSRKVGASK